MKELEIRAIIHEYGRRKSKNKQQLRKMPLKMNEWTDAHSRRTKK